MKPEFIKYIPVARALTDLMYPYVEVVLHDLKSGMIVQIFNNFSGRTIGDASLIDDKDVEWDDLSDYFPPYIKTGIHGERIKSTTAIIRNNKQQPIGLFCINFNLSILDSLKESLDIFSLLTQNLPQNLFKNDWKEKINRYVQKHLVEHHLNIKELKQNQRLELIKKLFKEGALDSKHAANHIAKALGVSRATIYKDLSKVR